MSRKSPSDSHNGFADVIGVELLAAALLLFVAQFSFDRYDLSFFKDPHNKPVHNWIGTIGAYLAWVSFLPFGVVGYLLPVLFAAFGVAYLLNILGYLRERLLWSLIVVGGAGDFTHRPALPAGQCWLAGKNQRIHRFAKRRRLARFCELRTDAALRIWLLPARQGRRGHCL